MKNRIFFFGYQNFNKTDTNHHEIVVTVTHNYTLHDQIELFLCFLERSDEKSNYRKLIRQEEKMKKKLLRKYQRLNVVILD